MEEKTIKKLEITSKGLLLLYVFLFFYFSDFVSEQKFYCLGIKINWIILFLPLIIAVILEIITLSIYKKCNLSIKKSIESFLKLFIISFITPFIIAVLFMMSPSTKMRAIDARKMADLDRIHAAQEKFLREKLRYAISLEELDQPEYISGIIEEAKKYNIIFKEGENSEMWEAYTYIREYRTEICNPEKPKDIYICDKEGCKEEVSILTP